MNYAVYVTGDSFENPNPDWIQKRVEKNSDEALRKARLYKSWYKYWYGYKRAKIVRVSSD